MDLPDEEKNRLIGNVEENNVEDLKQFTNPSKLHIIRTRSGDSLLQLSILTQSREVFDYLLSVEYPLELTNNVGETALYTASTCLVGRPRSIHSIDTYFVNKLIEKGANVNVLYNSTFLHCAIERNLMHAVKILIENGANVNKVANNGCTPLHMCLRYAIPDISVEIVANLLAYRADPLIKDFDGLSPFDVSVMSIHTNVQLQELLFLYTFDQHTEYKMNGSVLLTLAKKNPNLFLEIYKNIVQVELDSHLKYHSEDILTMEIKCLDVLIENFTEILHHMFLEENFEFRICRNTMKQFMTNLYYISNSKLQQDLVYFFSCAKSYPLLTHFVIIDKMSLMFLSEIAEIYCFMLSNGLHITEYDVQAVYRTFGYCELFKILLHMDIEKRPLLSAYPLDDAFPKLFYNFNADLPSLWKGCTNVHHLLPYYNDPVLKVYCLESKDEIIVNKAKSLPTIPLLIELARNGFRKHLVEKFKIDNSRQFYTLLKALPISTVYKKIITLETKLY